MELILLLAMLLLLLLFRSSNTGKSIHVNPFCMKADKCGKCTDEKNKKFLGIFRRYCVDFDGIDEYCEFREEPKRPDIKLLRKPPSPCQ